MAPRLASQQGKGSLKVHHYLGRLPRLCFHLQQDAYDTDSLIGVLEQLKGFYTGHRVVLIWDGLSAHWSHKMRAHRHCCICRSLTPASSTRAPERHWRCPGLIALSTSDSRPDGNQLHFAIRRWHLRARCNSAPAPTFDVVVATVGDPPAGQAARVLLAMLGLADRA